MKALVIALAVAGALGIPATSGAVAPPLDTNVGDADSFGSNAVWMGIVATGSVIFAADCTGITPQIGPDDRCVTMNGFTPVNFSFTDLGRVTLPANSTTSLLCHWATSNGSYTFSNPTAANAVAHYNVRPIYRLESKVLDGTPFNGGIDVPISGHLDEQTLAPGAHQIHSLNTSRDCVGGLITKAALINFYGLTAAQAAAFFRRPITIRMGVGGQASGVVDGFVTYGTRLMGDHP